MGSQLIISFLQSVEAALPAWLLLVGACIGHGFLMTTGLNVLYAWPLPHHVLRVTRKIDILLVFLGPLLFVYALDYFDTRALRWQPGSLRFYLAPYVVLCWLAGFVLAPGAQILYWLRRRAPHVMDSFRETVDVAHELGVKPVGRG